MKYLIIIIVLHYSATYIIAMNNSPTVPYKKEASKNSSQDSIAQSGSPVLSDLAKKLMELRKIELRKQEGCLDNDGIVISPRISKKSSSRDLIIQNPLKEVVGRLSRNSSRSEMVVPRLSSSPKIESFELFNEEDSSQLYQPRQSRLKEDFLLKDATEQ